MRRARALALSVAVALGVGVPSAQATTVDFEAPAVAHDADVTNQFAASKGVTFVKGAPTGAVNTPQMKVGETGTAQARGGTRALNISTDGSEFPAPDLAGTFTTTRSTVSLYARTLSGTPDLKLVAFAANGTVLDTELVELTVAGGWTQFTVATPGGASTIASFRLSISGGLSNASVRVDDLSYDDPITPPPADFALQLADSYVTMPAGSTRTLPLTINRINGSTGPITLTSADSASPVTFTPNPVPATQTAVTATVTARPLWGAGPMRFTGTPDAPSAGTAPRTVEFTLDVQTPANLRPLGDPPALELAPCEATTSPFQIVRAAGVTTPVHLSSESGPSEVLTSFNPAVTDGWRSDVTLGRDDDLRAAGPTQVRLLSRAEGLDPVGASMLDFTLVDPTFTDAQTGAGPWVGSLPKTLAPGDRVTLTGRGFCPGSVVRFGNARATAPLTVTAGGRGGTVIVPRLATDGPLTVISPAGRQITSPKDFDVSGYRDTNGFNFPNTAYQGGFDNWLNLYGFNQFLLQMDPCSWFGGHCPVPTPIPNPLSFIVFGIADPALVGANGSCFGFSLASRRIANGQGPSVASFGGRSSIFSIPDNPTIKRYIWSQHVAQLSAEYLSEAWKQSFGGEVAITNAGDLAERVRAAIRRGSRPLISFKDQGRGHAVIAYDVTDTPGGGFSIRVYDNNVPFSAAENDAAGTAASMADSGSQFVVAPDGQWDFPNLGWHGGLGQITVVDERWIPVTPNLPTSLDGIAIMIFASGAPTAEATQSIRTAKRAQLGDRTQATDPSKRIVEYVMPDAKNPKPILLASSASAQSIPVQPDAKGAFQTVVTGEGRASQVETTGLVGPARLQPGQDVEAVGLDFTRAKTVKLTLAGTPAKGTTGSLTADFSGALTGGATAKSGTTSTFTASGTGTLRLSMSASGGDRGPAAFKGAPIRLSGKSTISLKPNWKHPDRALRVTISSGGKRRTITVKNTARPAARVSKVKLKATRSGNTVTVVVTARVSGAAQTAVGSIGVSIKRRGKPIATKGVAATGAGLRKTTLTLTVPATTKGPFDVRAAVTAAGAGTTLSASSTGRGRTKLK